MSPCPTMHYARGVIPFPIKSIPSPQSPAIATLFSSISPLHVCLFANLRRVHDSGNVISLAWVVMPDHLHWLIQLNEHWPLFKVVKTLKARSALTINRYLYQHGSLWQRAYFDCAARKEEDIRQIARYIVANPLRAGLVRDIGSYPHWDCIWMTDRDETVLVE